MPSERDQERTSRSDRSPRPPSTSGEEARKAAKDAVATAQNAANAAGEFLGPLIDGVGDVFGGVSIPWIGSLERTLIPVCLA
jgi:hypothetical protein